MRSVLAFIVMLAVLLVLPTLSTAQKALKPYTLILDFVPTGEYVPHYTALEKGWYRDVLAEGKAHGASGYSVELGALRHVEVTGDTAYVVAPAIMTFVLNGQRISATFLPTLGILPALGRNFTAEEDVPNGPAVCIISGELWQTRFDAAFKAINDTL